MLFLLIFYLVEISSSFRILGLFPYSGRSHFAFFEPLLDSLHDRGHNLTIISYFPKKHKLENYRDISLTDFSNVFQNIYEFEELKQTRTRRYYGVKLLFDIGIESCNALKIEKMISFLKERNEFDIILAELFNAECFYGFAHHYNTPVISLSTCNIFTWLNPYFGNPDNPAYVPNLFLDHTDKMTSFISRLENTFLSIFQKLLYKFYSLPAQNLIAKDYFGSNLPDLQEIIRNYSTILLLNTHFIINFPRPLMPNIIEVAGLHLKQTRKLTDDVHEFINSATAGVILVSMGSMINGSTLQDNKKRTFINVFKKMPQKFIWKWETEEMIDKPDNVLLKEWISQLDVLKHPNVKGFISHGGLLSSIELVQCGVPAILIPQFADQFSNAAALQERKLAYVLKFPEIDEVKLTIALQTILSEKYQKRAKDVSKMFRSRSISALNTSVHWVEYIAKYREFNEIKSAATHLNFYQYYCLDIYAFIILIISLAFLMIFYITRKFFRTSFCKLKLE